MGAELRKWLQQLFAQGRSLKCRKARMVTSVVHESITRSERWLAFTADLAITFMWSHPRLHNCVPEVFQGHVLRS